ncbi:DNA topoisomerase IB [Microbacterium protaetiae]|uniref:DNA topoisomerase IB n=1 Tax=Microbacterium protaetiae TaxID=2509458 RepID=A0A4V0YDT0_9MICO|nr:DNA topoisomerase IB [Microbacterium protaetiae]
MRPDTDPGFRRVRAGSTFRYLAEDGAPASDSDQKRIRALVIPPAWEDVWIAREPLAHIQVVGTDAAGRRQYLYHPRWRAPRDRRKFARALALAAALPQARTRVTVALRGEGHDRERVLAVAFRLLDEAAPRVGSARYLATHGSRGLTTLRRRDASVAERVVTLSFPAKSGKRALLEIDDADLASTIAMLVSRSPRSPLLWYPEGRRQRALTPADVNAHVRALTGGRFTAKDFRTLRGTILAADALARIGTVDTAGQRKHAEALAVQASAQALGNTASVARASYIDPRVFQRYRQGRLLELDVSPETAIRRLLAATGRSG